MAQNHMCEQDIVDDAHRLQVRHEASTAFETRKAQGQFFTPPGVARFMAGLFPCFPRRLKLLDPGAGTGILSAAVCARIARLHGPRSVHIVLYETDDAIIPLLNRTMKSCQGALRVQGHSLNYEIRKQDFILSRPGNGTQTSLFEAGSSLEQFNAVIMNPPYYKLAKTSKYARVMEHIVHGQPNIYALFMALACDALLPGGVLVAITPRSFCNGLYFRAFRRWFLARMSLVRVHLFESRKEAFAHANVLQESLITAAERSAAPRSTIRISTSRGADIPPQPASYELPRRYVLDEADGSRVIRIPANPRDGAIMRTVESWPNRFTDHGLCISTGPVVMFRAKRFLLRSTDGEGAVPLLTAHNVRTFETVWPIVKNGKPVAFKVTAGALDRRLLVPTGNYVLLRRFSAKEERRRLTASCLFKRAFAYPYVAIENHLNYIYHKARELSDEETCGIAGVFNSVLLDRYFRVMSGNTQVNATELRTLHFPDLGMLRRIGRRILRLTPRLTADAERIVHEELGVADTVAVRLLEQDRAQN